MKKDREVSEYLLKIKKVVDSLSTVGAPIFVEEHIEVILDGLGKEYAALITAITSRTDPYSVDEIEALLLDQAKRIERYEKEDFSLVQANFAQANIQEGKKNG